jgi:hypothetical protein
MALDILATGVLLFECAFRSRTCSLLQATRFVRALDLFGFVDISLIPVELATNTTIALDRKQSKRCTNLTGKQEVGQTNRPAVTPQHRQALRGAAKLIAPLSKQSRVTSNKTPDRHHPLGSAETSAHR